ncbi:hypothetical protein QBC43DRAFT_303889 [Cladorrhinum sp. PSN259]|nr:hypothetical protein QBC43DRAFT_303889 [Cladorrhinum sp. PSN259]
MNHHRNHHHRRPGVRPRQPNRPSRARPSRRERRPEALVRLLAANHPDRPGVHALPGWLAGRLAFNSKYLDERASITEVVNYIVTGVTEEPWRVPLTAIFEVAARRFLECPRESVERQFYLEMVQVACEKAIVNIIREFDGMRMPKASLYTTSARRDQHLATAKFEQISSRLNWEDESKMVAFCHGLRDEIKDELESKTDIKSSSALSQLEWQSASTVELFDRRLERQTNLIRPYRANQKKTLATRWSPRIDWKTGHLQWDKAREEKPRGGLSESPQLHGTVARERRTQSGLCDKGFV